MTGHLTRRQPTGRGPGWASAGAPAAWRRREQVDQRAGDGRGVRGRVTAATLAYRYSHDPRAVQDLLGHRDPRTTARVVDMARTNPVLSVPVKLLAHDAWPTYATAAFAATCAGRKPRYSEELNENIVRLIEVIHEFLG